MHIDDHRGARIDSAANCEAKSALVIALRSLNHVIHPSFLIFTRILYNYSLFSAYRRCRSVFLFFVCPFYFSSSPLSAPQTPRRFYHSSTTVPKDLIIVIERTLDASRIRFFFLHKYMYRYLSVSLDVWNLSLCPRVTGFSFFVCLFVYLSSIFHTVYITQLRFVC